MKYHTPSNPALVANVQNSGLVAKLASAPLVKIAIIAIGNFVISFCVWVCMQVCLSVCLCLCLSVSLSLSLCLSLSLSLTLWASELVAVCAMFASA